MKVAVLGAPGVGKTEFANELADLLSEWQGKTWYVLDDYVRALQDATGLEYGGYGEFIDDLQIVFKRREWELCHSRATNTITVGTVLDSAIHNFVRIEEAAKTRHEVGIVTERLRTIAATFGLLFTDTWDYDYAFLLRSDNVIGRGLVDLLSTYRAPVFSFNSEVPNDKKAQTAFEAIRSLEEESATTPNERGVRSSGETGSNDRDSSESVPDVPEQRGTSDDA